MRNQEVLWFSLCEAVDQLQAEGVHFSFSPDDVVEKWNNAESQDRVIVEKSEDRISFEIKKEEDTNE